MFNYNNIFEIAKKTQADEFMESMSLRRGYGADSNSDMFKKILESKSKLYENGSIMYKVYPLKESFNRLLNRSRIVLKDSHLDKEKSIKYFLGKDLMDGVSQNIFTINKKSSFVDCIKDIKKVADELGDTFYGALLFNTSTKEIINPLHLISALTFTGYDLSSVVVHNSLYRTVIYTYTDRQSLNEKFNENGTSIDKDKIYENIIDLTKQFKSRSDFSTDIEILEGTEIIGNNISIKYKTTYSEFDNEGEEYFIIPNQVISRGIAVPYYGVSLIKKNTEDNSVLGTYLTPMMSCNISVPTEFSNYNKNKLSQIKFGSVCTGGLSNRTIKGLQTLSHANLSSPYHRDIITEGSLSYADANIESAFLIYEKEGFFKTNKKTLNGGHEDESQCTV